MSRCLLTGRAFWTGVLGAVLCCPFLPAAAQVQGFIVQWRDSAAPTTVDGRRQRLQSIAAREGSGISAGDTLTGRWQKLQLQTPLSRSDAAVLAQKLRSDPAVAAVMPDAREQRHNTTPNDTRYGEQWWLQAPASGNTGAANFTQAWDRSRGDPVSGGVAAVAVLDSGITSHPELNARLRPGYDFVRDAVYAGDGNGRDNDPADPGDAITAAERAANPAAFSGCPEQALSSWHGTVIAGQLAAVTNNGAGVAAANWQGLVLPVRVAGKCGAAVSDIIDGMRWAAGLSVAGVPNNPNPVRLIVLSYGGSDSCDVNSSDADVAATARLYVEAIAEVRQAGALVIAAAGNQRGIVGRPASCAGAFAVASLNREGYKAAYSGFGAAVALATPGGDGHTQSLCDNELADSGVVSTGNLGETTPGAAGYVAASGTSFAGPAVAATAALMLAVNPALSLAQLEDGLKRSARPHVLVPQIGTCSATDNRARCGCTTATCGSGMLDAAEALSFAAAPATWAAPVRTATTVTHDRLRACAVLMGLPVTPTTPTTPTTPEPPASSAGGSPAAQGGGGAVSPVWLLGLLAVVLVLALERRVIRPQR